MKRHADQTRPLHAPPPGGGQIDLADHALVTERHVADRREVVEVSITVARILQEQLRLAQGAVLRLQLDWVDRQLGPQP